MLGWGTADFLAAKSSRRIGSIFTLFWVQIIGFFVAAIYFLINLSSFNLNNIPRFLILLIIIGLLQIIAYLAFYNGLEKGQVSLVSPIGSSWGMITVILSVIFFNEALQISQIIAILLIILGIVLISIDIKELFNIKKLTVVTGAKEGFVAMLGWGISLFLIVPASQVLGWFIPVFIFRLFALLFLAFHILTVSSKISLRTSLQPSLLSILIPIGLLDIGAFFSYSLGVGGESASIVAPIAASFPLITIILARIFLKEKMTSGQIIGIAGIVVGLILITF